MKRVDERACFGGRQEVWEHESKILSCTMRFGVYLPRQAAIKPCPVVYWLSGLTCTEQNFITKAGAQRYCDAHGIVLVAPDTSPRGDDVADADGYDLGQGAGFYLNATEAPWAAHYKMYDYIVDELPRLIEDNFPVSSLRGISGHSMGGHGALVAALKRPDLYESATAFAPIVAPTQVPWGKKAFTAYLGENEDVWKQWDACELIGGAETQVPILVDQGDADGFLGEQLKPDLFEHAARAANYEVSVRMQSGFDHSYYFIASFIGEHLAHHADAFSTFPKSR